METRLSSGVPGCGDTKKNITSSSFHHHHPKPCRAEATWPQGQEFTVPPAARNVPSWKGQAVSQSALHRRPRLTLGLHTPLLHAEGVNLVFC